MEKNQNKGRLYFWHFILWVFLIVAMYLAYGVYFINITSTKSKWVLLFSGAVAMLYASCKILEMSFYKSDLENIKEEIKNLNKTSLIFFSFKLIPIFIITSVFAFLLYYFVGINYLICFCSGFLISLICTFFSNLIVLRTSILTREFSTNSLNSSYRIEFSSSAAISFLYLSSSAIILVILFHIFKDYQIISAFIFGIIFYCVIDTGSNIISKQAVKLVDSESDNIAAIKKLSINSFNIVETIQKYNGIFILAIIFAMAMGSYILNLMGLFLPLIIAANGIFASIIAGLLIKINKNKNPRAMIYRVVFLATVLFCLITYLTITYWLPDYKILAYNTIAGAIVAYILIFKRKKPSSKDTVDVWYQTFLDGIKNSFAPILVVAFCLVLTFVYCEGVKYPYLGLYSNSLFVLSLVSLAPIYASIHSFCLFEKNNQISNNELSADLISFSFEKYHNIALILVCFVMLIVFSIESHLEQADILNPYVTFALISGCATPFLWLAYLMYGSSKNASKIQKEGLDEFKILRRTSLISSFYSVCAIILPLFCVISCGLRLKCEVLAGYLTGVILSNIGVIILYSNIMLQNSDNCAEIKNAINIAREVIKPHLSNFVKITLIAAFSLITLFIG